MLIAIVVYQQIENYLFSPRITARTMELHPAIAFGAALGGAAVLGAVGAVLALPAAAMAQALISDWGDRHQVIKSDLVEVRHPRVWKRWAKIRKAQRADARTSRSPRRRAAASSRASTTAPSSPSPPTAPSPGPPATRTSRSSGARRSSRCRRRRWSAPGCVLDDRLLAVVCASHDGRPEHVAAVREILAGAGLSDGRPRQHAGAAARARRGARRRAGRRRARVDHPELQRQACGDARDVRAQRLADGRLPRPRPPACSA